MLPAFYADRMRRDLGALWRFLPDGALSHDSNAYLRVEDSGVVQPM